MAEGEGEGELTSCEHCGGTGRAPYLTPTTGEQLHCTFCGAWCCACNRWFPYAQLTNQLGISYTCEVCTEEILADMNDPAFWAAYAAEENRRWEEDQKADASLALALRWRADDLADATAPMFGPYALRCVFCGKWGDESTMDPISGDGQGCFACVDGYQRGPRDDGIEVVDLGEVGL